MADGRAARTRRAGGGQRAAAQISRRPDPPGANSSAPQQHSDGHASRCWWSSWWLRCSSARGCGTAGSATTPAKARTTSSSRSTTATRPPRSARRCATTRSSRTSAASSMRHTAIRRSPSIQPGYYQMRTEISAADAVRRLTDPHNRVGKLVIPEGPSTRRRRPTSRPTGDRRHPHADLAGRPASSWTATASACPVERPAPGGRQRRARGAQRAVLGAPRR